MLPAPPAVSDTWNYVFALVIFVGLIIARWIAG